MLGGGLTWDAHAERPHAMANGTKALSLTAGVGSSDAKLEVKIPSGPESVADTLAYGQSITSIITHSRAWTSLVTHVFMIILMFAEVSPT